MASLRANMLQLLQKYLNVMNNEGPDGLRAVMTPDFKVKLSPEGLRLTSPSGLDLYIDVLKRHFQATGTKNIKVSLSDGFEPVIDEETHRIVLHLQSTADSNFGPEENELIMVFKTTEDGIRIKEQHEFVDSAAFFARNGKLQGSKDQN